MTTRPTRLWSHATVLTDAPERYAKQLSSHLGHRLEIRAEEGGTRVVFPHGSCLLVARTGALELTADAQSADTLAQVEGVVGRHLEKFGARSGLVVDWRR